MTTSLSKLRKSELKDLARKLGVAEDGIREEIADRIRAHIAKHGATDPSLRDLVREESPRVGSRRSNDSIRLANLSSTNEDGDTSGASTPARSLRLSPKRSVTATRSGSRSGSDSDSAEDPLSEHQVRSFMKNVQTELHDVAEKVQFGKERIRRASVDFGSSLSNVISEVVHQHHGQHSNEGEGWCGRICSELKNHLSCHSGECSISSCMTQQWQRLQELGSTSTGFVWITFVFEFIVFMSAACSNYEQQNGEDASCLGFLTNWSNFLLPFFSYYGFLFVIPTLLSQLFNVDRTRKTRTGAENRHVVAGILSRTTTSGLSYFVFKFAVTYLLSHYSHQYHNAVSGTSYLGELAKGAAETFGLGGDARGYAHGCQYLAEVFRFTPAALSLSTSGAGTILALAETVVSRRR
ncbi:hypothetical protein BGX27_006001 [Mortierella sp. AM989]|nr:hypothetical protein BGX27_006001 [Mortierella sp. AM989]